MEQHNDWLDALREKVDAAEVHAPSDADWEGVRAALMKRKKGKQSLFRRTAILLPAAAAAVAALLILLAPHPGQDDGSPLPSQSPIASIAADEPNLQTQTDNTPTPTPAADISPEPAHQPVHAAHRRADNLLAHAQKTASEEKKEKIEEKKGKNEKPSSSDFLKKEKNDEANGQDIGENNTPAGTKAGHQDTPRPQPVLSDAVGKPSAANTKYLLALSVSGQAGAAAGTAPAGRMFANASLAPARRTAPSLKGMLTKYDYAYCSFRHQLPVSLAATASAQFGEFWGAESGLTFTRLKSDVIPMFGTETYEQKIDYLGIPLRLNGRLPLGHGWALYAGAGVLGEYCLTATLNGEKQEERPFQFALETHMGTSYSVDEGYELYFEPNFFWFLTKTELQTVRSAGPFSTSFRLGIRVALP